jgi:CheY-like chemotaxis protein
MKKTQPERILLAEDVPMVRKLIYDILSKEGYEVVCAEDGADAIHKYRQGRYDLVIMDVQMPCLDGFEVARLIREHNGIGENPPIIALTAALSLGQHNRDRLSFFDDFIRKPFRKGVLLSTVAIWLNRIGVDMGLEMQSDFDEILASDSELLRENLSIVGVDISEKWVVELETSLKSWQDQPLFDLDFLQKSVHNIVALAGTLGFFNVASYCATLEANIIRGGAVSDNIYLKNEARHLETILARIKTEVQRCGAA